MGDGKRQEVGRIWAYGDVEAVDWGEGLGKGTSRLGAAALGMEKEPQVSAALFMLGLTGIY